MSLYSKSSCPKCNAVLDGWHRSYITIGNPFVKCTSCGIILRRGHVNEWEAMSTFEKIEYYITFYFQAVFFYGMGTFFLMLLFDTVFNTGIFVSDNNLTFFCIYSSIIVAIVALIFRHKKFQNAIQESIKRTKDPNYRQLLEI